MGRVLEPFAESACQIVEGAWRRILAAPFRLNRYVRQALEWRQPGKRDVPGACVAAGIVPAPGAASCKEARIVRACCSRAARCCWRAGEVRASAIPRTARQNSDRPEQTAWWEQTVALFTGEPVFRNSTPVEADTPGDPSQAGFVQVMQGRSSDPDRARELVAGDPADWQEFRPDIFGTVSVGHDGDAWTMAIYFTSEEPAREGEQKEPPPEMQEMMKRKDAFTIGEPVFFDPRDPWLHAPS